MNEQQDGDEFAQIVAALSKRHPGLKAVVMDARLERRLYDDAFVGAWEATLLKARVALRDRMTQQPYRYEHYFALTRDAGERVDAVLVRAEVSVRRSDAAALFLVE